MIIGYARVSTDGQTLDAQHAALAVSGAGRVFAEKVSGAVTDRRLWRRQSRPFGPDVELRCPPHKKT
jgi:DNA invertase Pin-like site-specific DNA recombinase